MRKKMLMFVFVLMLMYSAIAIGYSTWIITSESNITPNFSGQAEISLGNYDTQTSIYDGKKIIDEYQEDNSDVKLPEELQPIIVSNYKKDFIYQSIDSEGNVLETLTDAPRNAGVYKITIEPKDEAINYEKIEINYTIKPRLIELVYGYNDSVDYYSDEMTSDIRKVYDGKQTYPLVKVKNLQEDEEGNVDVCDLEYEWGLSDDNNITRLSNVKDYSEEAYVGKILGKSNANYTFISDEEEIDNTKLDFTFKIEKRIIDIKWSDQVNFVYDGEIKNLQAQATNLVENDNVEIVLAGEQSNANAIYNSTINQQSYLLSGKDKYYTTAVNLIGDDAHNYALPDADLCAKEYIISQALLLANANDKNIIYGDIASNNGVSYNGFVNTNDELVVPSLLNISYNYSYDTLVKELRKVGEYEIIPNIETDYTNYYIVTSNGKLTVERKELMISLTSNILTYNGSVQMPQFVFDGFVYNETVDDIIEEISISQEIKLAKVYNDVIISIDENSNYKFNEFIFDVTVNPKQIGKSTRLNSSHTQKSRMPSSA